MIFYTQEVTVQVDIELLKQFESGLDPEHPEKSRIPARVLGYLSLIHI